MRLLDRIHRIGSKLKIMQVNPAPVSASSPKHAEPVKIVTKSITLVELMRELKNRDMKALSSLPAELSVPFDAIFEAAGVVTPAHGWNVEKLCALLAMEEFTVLEGEALTQAVLTRLETDRCMTEDLARDAIGRDQAIDAFEEFVRDKMQTRRAARRRRLADLRVEVARREEEILLLEEDAVKDRQEWRAWYRKKTDYEKMMAGALACLLDQPIVTLSPDED